MRWRYALGGCCGWWAEAGDAGGEDEEAAKLKAAAICRVDHLDLVAETDEVGPGFGGHEEGLADEAVGVLAVGLEVDGVLADGEDGAELVVGLGGLGSEADGAEDGAGDSLSFQEVK